MKIDRNRFRPVGASVFGDTNIFIGHCPMLMIVGRCPTTNIHWLLPLFHRTLPYANDFRALPCGATDVTRKGRSPLIINVGQRPMKRPILPLGRSPLINTVGQSPARIPHTPYTPQGEALKSSTWGNAPR